MESDPEHPLPASYSIRNALAAPLQWHRILADLKLTKNGRGSRFFATTKGPTDNLGTVQSDRLVSRLAPAHVVDS